MSDTLGASATFAQRFDTTPEKSPDELAAARTRRSVFRKDSPNPAAPPQPPAQITQDSEYEMLAPGTAFLDPEGNQRVKPWEIKSDMDYAAVPEGADFIDPEGNTRVKPTYQGLGFTAEMLHGMAISKEGRKKALEYSYPGKVQETPDGEFEIVDEGPDGQPIYRKPGKVGTEWGAFAGKAAAEAAPMLGAGIGAVVGGASGTAAAPGAGTAAGAATGLVGGAMAGRQFNNVLLSMFGIHESLPAQVSSMGWEGLGAAGGEVVGKAIAAVPGAIGATKKSAEGVLESAKTLGTRLRENLPDILENLGITPQRARYFLGTTPEVAEQSASIANRARQLGITKPLVAPSVFAPEAPGLKKIEEFDAVFRRQNVFGQGAEEYYNKSGANLLASPEIGIALSEPLTRAQTKVSSAQAGRLALDAARYDMAAEDAILENAKRNAQSTLLGPTVAEGGVDAARKTWQVKIDSLVQAHEQNRQAADRFVRAGLDDLRQEARAVLSIVKADENPGNAWREVGAKYEEYNRAVRGRAKKLYDDSHAAGGNYKYNTSSLADDATEFLKKAPEPVRKNYPDDIARIAKLAGQEADEAAGVAGKEAQDLTLAELHQLRSWLRYGIDYRDLTPDMKAGSLKLFERKVNKLIHDAKVPEQIKGAVKMLDQADAFYKDNIPFLRHEMVATIMDGLKAGVPPNPSVLAGVLFDPTQTEALRKARAIIGEPLWKTVEAAHLNQLIAKSSTLEPGMIDTKKFADQVLEMTQNGILETGYNKDVAARVIKIAQNIKKLDGSLLIKVEEGDTLTTLIRKGEAAATEAKRLAESDPLAALAKGAHQIEKDFQAATKLQRQIRRSEPLHFLYETGMQDMPVKAANKILADQDTIMAAAAKFGRDSTEFSLLRQVYAHRFFQRALGRTVKMRTELTDEKGMTEEVQALMFPGVTRKTMLQIVNDMEFLFSRGSDDFGGSLAAATRVLNPWQHIPLPKLGGASALILGIPGMTQVGRFALGKAFATIVDGVAHPNFLNWLAGNLSKGAAERAIAKQVLQQRLRLGGWLGAMGGMQATETIGQDQ